MVELAIPIEKSPTSDFFIDLDELGVDVSDMEAALVEGEAAVRTDIVPKMMVNISAPNEDQELQIGKKRKRKGFEHMAFDVNEELVLIKD